MVFHPDDDCRASVDLREPEQAGTAQGGRDTRTGAVTFVQRVGGALNPERVVVAVWRRRQKPRPVTLIPR
jgi:hypothetical protein